MNFCFELNIGCFYCSLEVHPVYWELYFRTFDWTNRNNPGYALSAGPFKLCAGILPFHNDRQVKKGSML